MQRALVQQRALLRRRIVAMRSTHGTERITLDGSIEFFRSSASGSDASPAAERAAPSSPPLRSPIVPADAPPLSELAAPSPSAPPSRLPIVPTDAPPLSEADVERLVEFVASCPPRTTHEALDDSNSGSCSGSSSGRGRGGLVVLTGAGISTESGLPDYRGPGGAYSVGFKPMTHQQFLASDANRRRYWARAFVGWQGFSAAEPGPAHLAIARLQRRGWIADVVTQNVDRLHTRAGAEPARVLELHGSTHDVVCLSCGAVSPRAPLQAEMAALNPAVVAAALGAGGGRSPPSPYVSAAAAVVARATPGLERQQQQQQPVQRRPDGDAEVNPSRDGAPPFIVPPCPACGAGGGAAQAHATIDPSPPASVALKPDVVFFGDGVPRERADRALALAETAGALLVVGSSLRVWSAFRLVKAAAERGTPIAVLNCGSTRADEQLPAGRVSLRLEALAGEALARLERHPRLQLPASSSAAAAAARWG